MEKRGRNSPGRMRLRRPLRHRKPPKQESAALSPQPPSAPHKQGICRGFASLYYVRA